MAGAVAAGAVLGHAERRALPVEVALDQIATADLDLPAAGAQGQFESG
jgi:hypothetical protein